MMSPWMSFAWWLYMLLLFHDAPVGLQLDLNTTDNLTFQQFTSGPTPVGFKLDLNTTDNSTFQNSSSRPTPVELQLDLNTTDNFTFQQSTSGPTPFELQLDLNTTDNFTFQQSTSGPTPVELQQDLNTTENFTFQQSTSGPTPVELQLDLNTMDNFTFQSSSSGPTPVELQLDLNTTDNFTFQQSTTGPTPVELQLDLNTTEHFTFQQSTSGPTLVELQLDLNTTGNFTFQNSSSGPTPVDLQLDLNTTEHFTFQQSTSMSPPLPVSPTITYMESFQIKLITQHVRFCGSNRVCLRYRPNRCWRCSPCQCDDKCQSYDDCCPDKVHDEIIKPSQPSLPVSCMSNLYGAYSTEERTSLYNISRSYFMVSVCPDNSSSAAAACSKSALDPPVTSYKDSLTYKNKFCAQCNNAEDLHQWKLMVDCNFTNNFLQFNSTKSVLDFALKESECWVVYSPPRDIDARVCYNHDDMISRCNETGLWPVYDEFLDQACHSYTTVKEVEGVKYRNVFCYMCNTENPSLKDLFKKCKKNNLTPVPFSALLDFGSVLSRNSRTPKSKCSVNQIFFEQKDSCRDVTCSRGKQLTNTSCIPTLSSAKGLSYELYFDVLLEKPLNLSSPDDPLLFFSERLKEYFPYSLGGVITFNQFVIFLNTTDRRGTCSQTATRLSVYSTFVTTNHVETLQFESSLLEFRNKNFTLTTETGYVFFQTTPNEKARILNDILHGQIPDDTRCIINVSLTDPQLLLPALEIDINGHSSEDTGHIRVSNLLLCPRIALEKNEFTFHGSREAINLIWMNDTLQQGDFEEDRDGTVRICLEDFELTLLKTPVILHSTNVEILLSIVCSTLSLVCLLLTSVTYCLFRNLRRLPGKNNINLTVNLFAAQLVYLLGSNRTDVKGLCEALGIFIHYLWLSVFCAMGICSFHMFHVFTTLRNREDSGERRRRYLQYCVFIYGIPAIVVAATLAIHIIVSQGSDIGYGGSSCYLSSEMAIGLAFALPVGVVVLVNMAFFILTARSIRSIPRVTKSKQDEHYTIVYVKLSSLTGITWILGFLAITFELEVLRFIFIVINASQGVFIFMSFICNRKILNLYLDCLKNKYPKSVVMTSCTTNSRIVLPSPTANVTVSNGVM